MDRKRVAHGLVRLAEELLVADEVANSGQRHAEELSDKQKKYRAFFEKKLKKYKVDSPSELSDEQKKKFFDEVDKDWDAENESD